MKYLCSGDRKFKDYDLVLRTMREEGVGPGDVVVHGKAKGADTLCGRAATELGADVVEVPADWKQYGKRAGPMRNMKMLVDHPDIERALFFHPNIKESKGTADMLARVKRRRPLLSWRLEPPQPGQQQLF